MNRVVSRASAAAAAALLIAVCGCENGGSRPGGTLLVYSSPSCGPCVKDKPLLDRIRQSRRVHVRVLDQRRDAVLIARLRLTRMPTYVLVRDGHRTIRTGDLSALVRVLH